MTNFKNITLKHFLMASVGTLFVTSASAADENTAVETDLEEVVVIGTHIKGVDITDTLPVTVMGEDEIEATGALTFEDLMGSLPQAGGLSFNSERELSNDVRGDVASLNLRTLGSDTTLILLNGRRMVSHPQTMTFNGVPIQFVNMNAIPTSGLGRIEVLRDGAAALYGTDAVAGVLNAVTRTDYEGLNASVRYGGSEGTDLREFQARVYGGTAFNDDRTKLSFSLSYYDRTGLDASERPYSENGDKRHLLPADSPFLSRTSFRNNSSFSNWGEFRVGNPDGSNDAISGVRVRLADGTSLTSSSGQFHLQPEGVFANTSQSGNYLLAPGVEIDDGSSTSSSLTSGNGIEGADGIVRNPLRYNMNEFRKLTPDTNRFNAALAFTHELDNSWELFGDFIFYKSDSHKFFGPAVLSTSNNFLIPKDYYWNPFGPTTLGDGSANPNRIGGINAPDEGLNISVRRYRFLGLGPRLIDVKNTQWRSLFGARGMVGDWDVESAFGYSEAKSTEDTTLVSRSLLHAELSKTTPDAFNIFNGGDVVNSLDSTSFGVDVVRKSKNTLTTWDLKVSNPDVIELPAGSIALGSGIEWRRETINDDRDQRLDGTITFTNPVSGQFFDSDLLGVSATGDIEATRNVYSAYAEAIVPILADLPMIQSLDLQIAGRFEKYSDVSGSVFKPRFAASWYLNDWIQVRGAWSKGFRAPNMIQLNTPSFSRFTNFQDDHARCSFGMSDCEDNAVSSLISGNPDLKPENSQNTSLGIVIEPPVVPGLVIAVDYWKINQSGTVGTVSRNDQIAIDELLRRTQNSFNPNVIRDDASAEDIAEIAAYNLANGTNITPFGGIIQVNETFLNLQDRRIAGVDFTVSYKLDDTSVGDFTFGFNAAYLSKFEQDPSTDLLEALADDIAADNLSSSSSGDLREDETRPKWRYNFSARWNNNGWHAGMRGRYVGRVFDKDLSYTDDAGEEQFFEVSSWFTMDFYGGYTFQKGALDGTRIRIGIKNAFDKEPPLFDNSAGYSSALHSNRGRYWYASVRKRF